MIHSHICFARWAFVSSLFFLNLGCEPGVSSKTDAKISPSQDAAFDGQGPAARQDANQDAQRDTSVPLSMLCPRFTLVTDGRACGTANASDYCLGQILCDECEEIQEARCQCTASGTFVCERSACNRCIPSPRDAGPATDSMPVDAGPQAGRGVCYINQPNRYCVQGDDLPSGSTWNDVRDQCVGRGGRYQEGACNLEAISRCVLRGGAMYFYTGRNTDWDTFCRENGGRFEELSQP